MRADVLKAFVAEYDELVAGERDEREAADRLRQVAGEREEREAADRLRQREDQVDAGGQRIDGDLLSMFIVECCPRVLTQRAAEEIAEKTLADLAGVEGVTIVRGPKSRPWKPGPNPNTSNDVVEAHICCEHTG